MEFKSNKAGVCPVCNGKIELSERSQAEGLEFSLWTCADCGKEGCEWYKQEFDGQSVMDEDGDFIEVPKEVEISE